MTKTIRGTHADLQSVRAPATIRYLGLRGSRIESLEGIERFSHVETIVFEKARTNDLRPLLRLENLKVLRILEPVSAADFDSILDMAGLEELSIHLFDAVDARHATTCAFNRLPRLTGLWLHSKEDYGLNVAAGWVPQLKALERLSLGTLGIREEDTDAVTRAGSKLTLLQFKERSEAQTRRITDALGPGIVDVWEPPDPAYGRILEIDGTFSMALSFPRFTNALDRDIYAQTLLESKWKDLTPDLEMDPDADMIYFNSPHRHILEELLKRATVAHLV
jgi:hypothetical protein